MRIHRLLVALVLAGFLSSPAHAKVTEYNLTVERLPVNVTGTPIKKVTVNGSIPAPTLRFTEGDEAVIHVTNKMNVMTSVHWHGIILPGEMDGYQICKILKAYPATKDIPVVMLSGRGDLFDKIHASLVGAQGYLTKPVSPQELLKAVKSYCNQQLQT